MYDMMLQSVKNKKGDHFAASGNNDRIWNSFIDYYSNPWLRIVSAGWLGPAYRVTAQVNIVNPAGSHCGAMGCGEGRSGVGAVMSGLDAV
ncbi:hypothetical protein P175DRAFT_0503293 [Aspergillus ochraceoroseus IBT 24754]|uniref:Uncharacterized protein n=1 Tax=Aspergillus ochraceoroseus IBT 24754 TaxID=1392256 RepID=A0A2T5LQC4_9EURO|nr:uncharacterized protein P175DRAFT_0503293 [Aspergillus ochraceoroseus IBT 24754]PTU18492.1 hypothetical protein P175DRAFT_0503293 [Aspergillus ochraceoroseus IBT 24754]